MRAALIARRLFAAWLALPEACLPPAELRVWRPYAYTAPPHTLSYPTDEHVGRILKALSSAAPFEVSALPALVDLPHEDLKNGIATLCIEGLVRITEAVRRPGPLRRHFRAGAVRAHTPAWIRITPCGAAYLRALEANLVGDTPRPPKGWSRETLPPGHGNHAPRPAPTRGGSTAMTTIYYAGPEELAAPALAAVDHLEPTGSVSTHRESVRRALWRCASHHLIDRSAPGGAPRVLLCDPAAEIERHDADPRHPHEAAVGLRLSLSSVAQELCSHLRESTHPRFGGRAALVINEPQLLSGAHANRQTLLLCASLAAYVRWATTLGVACYVAAADPRTLPKDLRRALEEEASVWRPAAAPRVAVVPRMPTARARGGAAPVQPPARRRTA